MGMSRRMSRSRRGDSESARRLRRVTSSLLRRKPFYGSLALALESEESSEIETIATDGRRLVYDAEWVREASFDRLETAVARLCLACALKHHVRRGERDYRRWQIASTAVTLNILESEDFAMPDDKDRDMDIRRWISAASDKTAEQLFNLLEEAEQDDRGDGDGDGDGEGESSSNEEGGRSNDPAGTGEVLDAPSAGDEKELREEEQRWDNASQQADRLAQAEGRGSPEVSRLIEESHKSLLSWRDLLRRFMLEASKSDYTWSRPNRRFVDAGLYLPSAHALDAMPPVVFAVDSSGSVSNEMLGEIWAEVRGAVEEIAPRAVWVVQCDDDVRAIEEYQPTDMPEELDVKGGGGTRFSPVWDAVAEREIDPACLIYLTDLLCTDFGDEPEYPVLWADWGRGAGRDVPFGEVVDVAVRSGE